MMSKSGFVNIIPVQWKTVISVYFLVNWIFHCVLASPGTFVTFDVLQNKRLPNPLNVISSVEDVETCEGFCIQDEFCESFAISRFERSCQLYKLIPGTPTIDHNNYILYVKSKNEEDGYYVYENSYLKLMLELRKFRDAEISCNDIYGSLVAVENTEMNELLLKIMTGHNVWEAFIGLTDADEENQWKYMKGTDTSFENWDYKGVWERKDKNCALITINGKWKHENCESLHYFFCQVQMY